MAQRFHSAHFSTCVYGLIDVTNSDWTYSSAGHLPLLIRDGAVITLDAPHGPPIGAGLFAETYDSASVRLKPNDIVALYTDGLVERRGEPLDCGIKRLGQRLAAQADAIDLFSTTADVVRDLAGSTPADDVALVVVRLEDRCAA
jgi:serine phosphatase RsbU (regulator of sigma subunit)